MVRSPDSGSRGWLNLREAGEAVPLTRVGAACLGDGTVACRHGQGLLRPSTLSPALIRLALSLKEGDPALRASITVGRRPGWRRLGGEMKILMV